MSERAQRARRAARGVARSLIALGSAAVLAVTGYGWGVQRDLAQRVQTSDVVDRPAPAPDGPVNALLVGIDSRTDARGDPLPPELLAALHAGPDEGQFNTDSIVLLHLPADPREPAVAVSVPRDSYVAIAGGHGTHKINTAYRYGMEAAERLLADAATAPAERRRATREAGRRTLIATVERLTGARIDHFAEINMAGFVELTEAVGGIPVCLNEQVTETRSGIDLPAGPQTVSGPAALAFVRQRHGLDGGDLSRIERQQAFLSGLAASALGPATIADPDRVRRLVAVASRYVVLDEGWAIPTLVAQLRRAAGDVEFATIPTGSPALDTPVDGIAVQVDPATVRRFVRAAFGGGPLAAPARTATPRTAPAGTAPAPTTGPRRAGLEPAAARASSTTSTARPTTAPPSTSRPTTSPQATPAPHTAAPGVPCVD